MLGNKEQLDCSIVAKRIAIPTLAALVLAGCSLGLDKEIEQCNAGVRAACRVVAEAGSSSERITSVGGRRILEEEISAIKAKEAELSRKKAEEARIAAEKATWGQWEYSTDEDMASGKKGKSATLLSENKLSLGFPYEGEQNGRLTLRQHPRHGFDVIISIEKGQILCSEYSNPFVLVRFDGGGMQRYECAEAADYDSTYTFLRNAEGFESQMRNAKTAYITLTLYQEGTKTLKFKVKGFDASKV